MAGKMATYKCKSCKQPFEARTADRARGWAKFCSKSCKAKMQENNMFSRPKGERFPRHDGKSPMQFKRCHECGEPAVNGVYTITGIEWHCAEHKDDTHPFSSDGHGQW